MLYLIGVAHRVQARKGEATNTNAQGTFAAFLEEEIKDIKPVVIAEELCEETITLKGEVSIAKEIAAKHGIEHRFCDPSHEERNKIGYKDLTSIEISLTMADVRGNWSEEIRKKARAIEIGCYFPVREQFWLERLNGYLENDAIFICGDLHIESFTKLIDAKLVPHKLVGRRIGVTDEDKADYEAANYLKAHPEIAEDWFGGDS